MRRSPRPKSFPEPQIGVGSMQFGQITGNRAKFRAEFHAYGNRHLIPEQACTPELSLEYPLGPAVVVAEAGDRLTLKSANLGRAGKRVSTRWLQHLRSCVAEMQFVETQAVKNGHLKRTRFLLRERPLHLVKGGQLIDRTGYRSRRNWPWRRFRRRRRPRSRAVGRVIYPIVYVCAVSMHLAAVSLRTQLTRCQGAGNLRMGRHIDDQAGDPEAFYIGGNHISAGACLDPGSVGGDMDPANGKYFRAQLDLFCATSLRS